MMMTDEEKRSRLEQMREGGEMRRMTRLTDDVEDERRTREK
jgi:hypothetical protein